MYHFTDTYEGSTTVAVDSEGKYYRITDAVEKPRSIDNILDHFTEQQMRTTGKKRLTMQQISKLRDAINKDVPPDDDMLKEIYTTIRPIAIARNERSIISNVGGLMMVPTKDKTDRIFIGGPAGSGKTYLISRYIEILRKLGRAKRIFLFSDLAPEEDTVLEQHGPMRILLDQQLVDNPIQTKELEDSLCIFDDVDSITDKDISAAVLSLYDSILKKGSTHNNIDLIVTSHNLNDNKKTKNIVINSNYIVVFPRTKFGIEYLLTTKAGFDKQYTKKILDMQSRYAIIHKNYPNYVIGSNEIFLI